MNDDSFRLIETMRADGDRGVALLDRHLARLRASCEFFGIGYDAEEIAAVIARQCAQLSPDSSHRLRLTVDVRGRPEIAAAPVGDDTADLRLALFSSSQVDPADTFLYHKTSRRELYDREWAVARERGVYEVLYLNTRAEVAEGSRTNIFVDTGGMLATPPVECGLLPGVYRSFLLDTSPSSVERRLTAEDLSEADAIYVCNAVTGLVQVRLIDSRTSITQLDAANDGHHSHDSRD